MLLEIEDGRFLVQRRLGAARDRVVEWDKQKFGRKEALLRLPGSPIRAFMFRQNVTKDRGFPTIFECSDL